VFLRAEHTGIEASAGIFNIEIGRKLKERGYALCLSLSSLMALTSSGPVVSTSGSSPAWGHCAPGLLPVRRTS
jgi:hypothetical protein